MSVSGPCTRHSRRSTCSKGSDLLSDLGKKSERPGPFLFLVCSGVQGTRCSSRLFHTAVLSAREGGRAGALHRQRGNGSLHVGPCVLVLLLWDGMGQPLVLFSIKLMFSHTLH